MLSVTNLNSGYGKLHVLFDISLECEKSEIVSVIGPNGSGKTTLLNSIFGLADIFSGSIIFDGRKLNNMPPHEISKVGIAYLPQMNNIFADLSVKENLLMAGYSLNSKKELKDAMDEVLSVFPTLEPFLSRKAGTLSGGERQMLAIAMTLVRKPRLIMLDEPLSGLAPVICQKILEKIVDLRDKLGVGIVLVEQNAKKALSVSDRTYLVVSGKNVFSGKPDELLSTGELVELYLGLKAERK
ncbi:MAG: ABC transporter ATP-binding protein [Candidatus Bathyarchaeia archaeon]